MNKLEELLIF